MSRPADHQVAIVGAGAAGAMTAYYLARAGIDVALLERRRLPRYKPCGGGISGRTRRALPFAIDPVIEHEVTGISFDFRGHRLVRHHSAPIAWMVMRDRFDRFLVERALEAGARLVEGANVRQLVAESGKVTLRTSAGELAAEAVVGADGASSVVAREAGLMPNLRNLVALEHEVACDRSRATEWDGLVEIDVRYQPWGYGWVFPKADHLSVGVALTPGRARSIRRELDGYRARRGLLANKTLHAEGHKIPSRDPRDPAHARRVVLVGDAAGLADEFSAEGIFYAIASARLAAAAVEAFLRHAAPLDAYTRALDTEIMPELAAARGVSRAFFGAYRRWPWLMRRVIESVDYYTHTLFQVQAGETSYVEVQRRWPMLRPLWRALNRGSLAV